MKYFFTLIFFLIPCVLLAQGAVSFGSDISLSSLSSLKEKNDKTEDLVLKYASANTQEKSVIKKQLTELETKKEEESIKKTEQRIKRQEQKVKELKEKLQIRKKDKTKNVQERVNNLISEENIKNIKEKNSSKKKEKDGKNTR